MFINNIFTKYINILSIIIFIIVFFIVLGHIFIPYDLFNMSMENNLPTWFSSVLLFLVAIIALINYTLSVELKDKTEIKF